MSQLTGRALFKQVLLAVSASLGYLTIGLVRGYSSTAIPSMVLHRPDLVPDNGAISWICGVPPLGAFVGSLCAGPLLQYLGRRRALLLCAPIFAAAWSSISYSDTWTSLVLSRATTGFCVGIVLPSAQVYVSECAHASIRGVVGSLPALFMAAGILISYFLGTWLQWDDLAFVSGGFPFLLFLVVVPLPESPVWLRAQGRTKEANAALTWLHLEPSTQSLEMYTIPVGKQPPAVVTRAPTKREAPLRNGAYSLRTLNQRSVLFPFFLVAVILIFQQISGIDTIIFYTVAIFHNSGSTINDYWATVLVGLVQLLVTSISLFSIDKFGRKPLLVASGLIMALSMSSLGTYFYLYEHHQADSLGLVPLISQLLFITGFSIGYNNVPFVLMGELLPAAQRSVLSSVASAFNLGSMFIVIKTYPDLAIVLGQYGVFWMYSLFCLLSCIFVLYLLPETKGKSLEEIEQHFQDEMVKETMFQKTVKENNIQKK